MTTNLNNFNALISGINNHNLLLLQLCNSKLYNKAHAEQDRKFDDIFPLASFQGVYIFSMKFSYYVTRFVIHLLLNISQHMSPHVTDNLTTEYCIQTLMALSTICLLLHLVMEHSQYVHRNFGLILHIIFKMQKI